MDEAMCSAELLYNNEEIVLDYNDHYATDIDISNLTPFSDKSDFLTFILLKAEKSLVNQSIEELAKIGFGNLSDAIKEYLKVKN